jgi:peroxiredoxin Q/BCP
MLKAGDPAPDFTLVAHDGAKLSLASLRGVKVLLWFFVEANTPACALEGRGFRDHQAYFDESNIRVVGISFDSPEDNAAFARKYEFGFPLLSDSDHAVAIAYGACSGAGARYPERMSFLIDERGAIERVYDQVDPRDHPARVLADVLGV